SGSSSTVAFTERPLCQPTSGPAQALQEPDQEQDDEDQQENAPTDDNFIPSFRSWTRMGGEREIPRLRAVHTSIRQAMRAIETNRWKRASLSKPWASGRPEAPPRN